MTMSIRMSEEDQKLIRDFAKLYNMTASEFIRRAVMEKIEDEVDISIAEQAYAEYKADPVTYTHDEVGRMLGLK
ncbi:MAG: CopG family transcriptional regulator [Clostridia bacterium]|nr:CopG family transcriptional regulator [Clostridia bacterium]MBO4884103.1 CopG family transcriptional regulator [Clostridia bacterium]MBR4443299.1 CopG family transcriptional regulator [Clostridia bacterium]